MLTIPIMFFDSGILAPELNFEEQNPQVFFAQQTLTFEEQNPQAFFAQQTLTFEEQNQGVL